MEITPSAKTTYSCQEFQSIESPIAMELHL